MVGAVLGGIAGYLFLTEHGRRLRRSLEPALDDLSRELSSFRATVQRATSLANEGWQLLNDMLADAGGGAGNSGNAVRRFPNAHQSSPF
jgi:gas vesicle protein